MEKLLQRENAFKFTEDQAALMNVLNQGGHEALDVDMGQDQKNLRQPKLNNNYKNLSRVGHELNAQSSNYIKSQADYGYLPEFQPSDQQIINIFENKNENNKELRSCFGEETAPDHISARGQDPRPKTSDNVNFNPRKRNQGAAGPSGGRQTKPDTSQSPINEKTTRADQQSMVQMGKTSQTFVMSAKQLSSETQNNTGNIFDQ
jgi:hypothetical protein